MNEKNNESESQESSLEIVYELMTNVFNRQQQRISKHEATARTLISWILVVLTFEISAISLSYYNGWRPNEFINVMLGSIVIVYILAIIFAYLAVSFKDYKEIKIKKNTLKLFAKYPKKQLIGGLIYYLRDCYSNNEKIIDYRIDRMVDCSRFFIFGLMLSLTIVIYSWLIYI